MEISTDTRAGRMLAAMVEHGSRNARVVVTVDLTRADGRSFHQAFRLKTWDGRDGKMLTADLMDGDWAAGIYATKVTHTSLDTGETRPARGMRDDLMVYAAKVAVRYATTGTVPEPANGTVAAAEEALCGCCGRELTHPVSIDLGIGPECAKRCGLEHHYRGQTISSRAARTPAEEAQTDVFGAPVGTVEREEDLVRSNVRAAADALRAALALPEDPHDARGNAASWLTDLLRESEAAKDEWARWNREHLMVASS